MTSAGVYISLARVAAKAYGAVQYEPPTDQASARRDLIKYLDRRKFTSGGMMLVVFDEIDMLSTTNKTELLRDLFVQASSMDTRMVLIGVGNSLSLMEDYVLPELRKRTKTPFIPTKTNATLNRTTICKPRATPQA